jgi:hypothetical protein
MKFKAEIQIVSTQLYDVKLNVIHNQKRIP